MKVGDLVGVGAHGGFDEFVSIVLAICTPEEHRNGMYLVKVFDSERKCLRWYPVGYIKVINESR